MKTDKKKPLRMCVACRELKEKDKLIKVTKTLDNTYSFDEKAQGRGAYICKDKKCLTKCVRKKLLNRALKANTPQEVYDRLEKYYEKEQN